MIKIINADVMDGLASLPDGSVQCVVTSPPYWALRDYGNPGQIGLEKTPQEYLDKMVAVFREVRRVLREDGTCWVNMGDGYASSKIRESFGNDLNWSNNSSRKPPPGLKHKDLVGMPWRLALALQADGWWLRSDIIWHKPNPMPESVTDRPTKSHEYVFLLTRAAKYYYDGDAIREEGEYGYCPTKGDFAGSIGGTHAKRTVKRGDGGSRNKRTVWTIPTAPYPGPHYSTFPPALPEICIKAGTSEKGCCPECGAPWERIVEKKKCPYQETRAPGVHKQTGDHGKVQDWLNANPPKTTGWKPGCECNAPDSPIPCTVLDPFNGHGTTGLVASRLGRAYIGIEINAPDCQASKERIEGDNPMFNKVEIIKPPAQ